MSDDGKIVELRTAVPTARLKSLDWSDKRTTCEHRQVEIWAKEPIIECASCGAVVDPYSWLRGTIGRWSQMIDAVNFQKREVEAEVEELKAALRILRKEYRDEAEKRRAESHLMHMPPRRRV